MPQRPPQFIALEGLDGSGKDTVLAGLFPLFFDDTLKSPLYISKYHDVLRTREPTTNSRAGRSIRKKLEDGSLANRPVAEVTSLYIEDRIEHSKKIRIFLNQGCTVLSSRYDLSTYAYQTAMGEHFDRIYEKHRYGEESGALIPDTTLFFQLDADEAWNRIEKRKRKKEALEDYGLLKKTCQAYKRCSNMLRERDHRRIIEISAHQSPEKVLQDTIKQLSSLM